LIILPISVLMQFTAEYQETVNRVARLHDDLIRVIERGTVPEEGQIENKTATVELVIRTRDAGAERTSSSRIC
jgi:hypothetical protein